MYIELRKRIKPYEIYLARPNQHIIGRIDATSAKLHMVLNDIWELSVEIDKYTFAKTENKNYSSIGQYMELYIKDIGWFRINGEPEEREDYSNGKIYKSFTAYGYETQLQDVNLNTFYINNGLAISMEMFEENLDALGIPKRNIGFYINSASDDPTSSDYWGLGLLNIIEHEYLSSKGWSIGHVDTELKNLKGRKFEIDSQDIYSFLTQDACSAYKCIFTFDRINKKINAYKVENLGKSLNIEMSRRNLLNSVTITGGTNECSYTRFRVAGATDETTISYVNFGSDLIENLSYFIYTHVGPECSNKYKTYIDYKESRRDDYANTIKQWLKIQQAIDVLHQQLPIDECTTNWNALETEELKKQLEQFKTLLATLEAAHTVSGVLSIENTPDYAIYLSIKNVIIPGIEETLTAREEGRDPEKTEYKTDWNLYGIDELEIKKKNYENQVQLYKDKGYDVPWEEGNSHEEGSHTSQYNQYLKYKQYVEDITARLDSLYVQETELKATQKTVTSERDLIVSDVAITNEQFNFSEQELADINALYRESDYVDSNIEFQSLDDIDVIIELAKELLNSAKEQLEKESRPQSIYITDSDNPFKLQRYKKHMDKFEMGDFIYMELDGGRKVKQRAIGATLELIDANDNNIEIEFSDMTLYQGKASDYDFLLKTNKSSNKNSISKDVNSYTAGVMTGIAQQVLNNYLDGNGSLFPNGIGGEDLQKIIDILDGLVGGTLSLEELKAKLAQIETLEADSAFIKYLNAQYIVGEQAEFKELKAKLGMIDSLLTGTISTELGHIINLTAENVKIDEAVIKQIIAAQILVSDLKAGDITLDNQMRILSKNGLMVMNGETLQIMGTDSAGKEYVAIQLGYDSQNKPSLIIRDETGAVMLDAQGLHENIVPDGFIKNDMIADKAVSKGKIDWSDISEGVDENGNPVWDISQVTINGEGAKTFFTQIKEEVSEISDMVKSVSITADSQVFKSEDGGITYIPDTITFNPIILGDIKYSKWQYSMNGGKDWIEIEPKTKDGIKATVSSNTLVLRHPAYSVANGILTVDPTLNVGAINGVLTSPADIGVTIKDGTLTLKNTSCLFTKNLSSISFKCIADDDKYYSVITVLKMYDGIIGGRNLAQNTSATYSNLFSNFTGVTNTCPSLSKVLTDGLKVGDSVSVRLIYKYRDIVAATGRTASCVIQGEGNVTGWASGSFYTSSRLNLSGNGEYEFSYTFTVTENHLKNDYWWTNIRHDYVASGSVQWMLFKVERGSKSTDWTPALEDVDKAISQVQNNLDDFNSEVNGAFKDGIIQESEALAIKQNLNIIQSDKAQLDKDYTSVYDNNKLSGTAKTNLLVAKTDYDSKYFSLVTAIQNAIADGKATSAEATAVNTAFSNYKTSVGVLKQRLQEALDYISTAKIDSITIGGRNLLINSNFTNGTKKWAGSNGSTLLKTSQNDLSVIKLDPLTGSSTSGYVTQSVSGVDLNTSYVFSSKVYVGVDMPVILSAWYSNSGWVGIKATTLNLTAGWNDVSMTFTSNDTYNVLTVGVGCDKGKTLCIYHPQLEKGKHVTDWSPAPEDFEEKITAVNTTITNISLILDNIKKEIEAKVTQSEIDKSINGIKPDIENANRGLNKWLIEVYDKSSLPSENRELSNLNAFFGTGILPGKSFDLKDTSLTATLPYGKDYIGYAVTFAYFDTATTLTTALTLADTGTVYLQGKEKNPANGSVTLNFIQGWNILEVVWNVNSSSTSGGFKFGTSISSHTQCKFMNCYYKTITSRETMLVDKYAGTKITVDSIETKLSETESKLVTKADGTEVHELSEKVNKTIDTVTAFERTVSETYITNDYKTYMETKFEQLNNSIKLSVTEEQLNSAIAQNSSSWRIDFSENGATCGSMEVNKEGITVGGDSTSGYTTKITSQEFAGWYNGSKMFWFNQEEMVTESFRTVKGIDLQTIKITPIKQNGYGGIDLLGSNAIL